MKKNLFTYSIILLSIYSCEKDSTIDVAIPEVQQPKIEEGVKATYNLNVKPILDSKCVSCHSSAFAQGNTNLDNFSDAKNAVSKVISRINKNEGDSQMMPQGGSKLSQNDRDIIQKWSTDGLLEKN